MSTTNIENPTYQAIGEKKVSEIFQDFLKMNDHPVVSVGSGIGWFEKLMETKYDMNIICVDPHPTSNYNKSIFENATKSDLPMHMPDFRTCDDLLLAKPDLIGNCKLLLIYPTPDGGGQDYDFSAIQQIQPSSIFLLVDVSGSAGGEKLLTYLNRGVENDIWCSLCENDKDFKPF